jgi:hypothetical protein
VRCDHSACECSERARNDLRATKPAERRVAREVCLARVPDNADSRDLVHVVDVKHGAVHHRIGQVGGVASVGIPVGMTLFGRLSNVTGRECKRAENSETRGFV